MSRDFYRPQNPFEMPDRYKNHPETDPHSPWPKPPHPKDPGHKTPPLARSITIADLFPRIDRWGIGWSPLLEQLKLISDEKPSYPPYNIIELKDGTTSVTVAVAGFTKKEIEITVHESVLKVEGKKKAKKETGEVVYQGIAARDFTLNFALADYYEVKEATVEDGMLTITLFKNVPEEKKPKVIDIK